MFCGIFFFRVLYNSQQYDASICVSKSRIGLSNGIWKALLCVFALKNNFFVRV